ncbi:MAG: amidohydrolase family protein [SAR202 cluster bacterium]|jgi:N-acyl-D-amino-acid deacylase|nr:amidohydrolase family protein [SAR202 cluster bacterium]
MLDILIYGGSILDGSGNPAYAAAIGITGDRISIHRGDVSLLEASRKIDAKGYIVSPGFVDLHSHAGLTILGSPHHEPKVRQGVTTELVGIDGISHAPFKTQEELERYIWLDSGLNGYPPMPTDWLTVQGLLSKYEESVAVNIAYILGNSPVRIWGVGWGPEKASASQTENMKSVVRESMEEGAWGISTGLDYPPGAYASTEELIELSRESARLGGFYHTHTRASLKEKGRLAPWLEALDIGKKAEIPVHLTHYRQGYQGDGSHLDYLGLVDNARENGMDVTFDCYTYPYSGTTITIGLPHWAKDGGPERLMAALRNPDDRAKMKKEVSRDRLENNWLTNFNQPKNKIYEGKSITEISDMRNQDPADSLFDLLLEENLGISTVGLGTNPQTLPAFVSHPAGMIASDAILFGDFPNPRTYGCFPIVLSEFVRSEKQLSLPEAIRKMTSFPAQRLGLRDRGLIKDGFKADLVLFDPGAIEAPATKENPKQYAVGIDYVFVNGKAVIDNGKSTGTLSGRSLRRGKD